jgi:hypothetical protein
VRRRSRNKGTVRGEVPEGPPGSNKSVACVKRSTQELGRPSQHHWFVRNGRGVKLKIRRPERGWESDQMIVLGGRESRPQGEASGRRTKSTKETLTGHCRIGEHNANLNVGNSREGKTQSEDDRLCLGRKRVRLKSPVRKNRTPGSVRGASGN